MLHTDSMYSLCITFLAKEEECLYLDVIMMQYGVNLEGMNLKVMMINRSNLVDLFHIILNGFKTCWIISNVIE